MSENTASRIGLGLAAIGRPAYITSGRDRDLGDPAERTIDGMRRRAHELLEAAWESGIRYVDAARSYGDAEGFLGSWVARHPGRRDRLTIGSKWGYEYVGNWRMDAPQHERKEHSLAMFERQWPHSVAALGTHPDLYLIHSVTPESPALSDGPLLDALRRLADDGVRVGISTSGPEQSAVIERALDVTDSPFSVVQATWNLLEPSAGPALAHADATGWLVVVKEALANGRLVEPDAAAARLADGEGQSADAFAIGAVLAQPWADIVLSGAVTVEQLHSNLAAREPGVAAADLAALTIDPAQYWAERSARGWA
ncbi:aldo/keto reductase [uncultured Schumannella sp.]|uniref:aldo/keto reductase n=1 Tax=uncultured Schumannella sp. TaxID=1195956 RepID=UPI0025F7F5E4|nr:aldo/keto reductase [uncultured Schumannella sp.]